MDGSTSDLIASLEASFRALQSLDEVGGLPPALAPLLHLAPDSGMEIVVSLRPRQASGRLGHNVRGRGPQGFSEVVLSYGPSSGRRTQSPVRELGDPEMGLLVRCLDTAEQDPTFRFVALKFLRDRLLPETRAPWTESPEACQRIVGTAIERGLIATRKVPNPKNPEFPVTGVTLERRHPEVIDHLGAGAGAVRPARSRRPPAKGDASRERHEANGDATDDA